MILKILRRKSRLNAGTSWHDAFISVCILISCSLIGFLFYSLHLSEANIISIYILGILLIASITSSWVYGTISSVCGVLLFNCLYAHPIFNFNVYDSQYLITMVVMLIASLITNYVMTIFRWQLDREKMETRRLDILLETSQHLQQTQNDDDIYDVALTQIYHMIGHAILIFPLDDRKTTKPMIKASEQYAKLFNEAFTFDNNVIEQFIAQGNNEKSTVALINNELNAVCFKLRNSKTLFAVICIVIDSKKSIVGFEYNIVLAMLDEIAFSLEKHHLHLFNERIAREAEAERLRTNLLRTISHDLRTPLTSILGNADILLSNGEQIASELRKQLYQTIYSDSEWLITLVENLLFITRIDNGVMSINTEPEVLQEIIPESLSCVAKRAKEHAVNLEMPDELLVVKMDARLFLQVIINIVDNAIKYTPLGSTIHIRLLRRNAQAVIEIADEGCGITDSDKKKVFEMFYTSNKISSDSRRGIGLGLPLCQSIVSAHGGTITLVDNTPRGLVVTIVLQLEEVCFESEYSGR